VLNFLCGSVRVSAGSGVLICMYWCVLVVAHFGWSVRDLAGSGVLNCMYYCVFLVRQFVWDCEWVSRKWRTELYVLLFIGNWTFCVGV